MFPENSSAPPGPLHEIIRDSIARAVAIHEAAKEAAKDGASKVCIYVYVYVSSCCLFLCCSSLLGGV